MKKIICLSFLLLTSPIFFLIGCNSQELSRSQAQKLVEASSDFKQPFALSLTQGKSAATGQGSLPILPDRTETPQEAEVRKIKTYFELYPQVDVANHLGLVEPRVKSRLSEQPKHESWMDEPLWWFDEKYVTTDKAKALWKVYDLSPSEDAIPLAKKDFVEVTGVTKQGKEMAQAQFTWKFVPNETSKYFDSAAAEFRTLPANIQQGMLGKQPATILNRNPEDKTIKFAPTTRAGQAVFRRYDDGWRLESVAFQ